MGERKKLTILNHPFYMISIWWKMHWLSLNVCGDWFGVAVYPNGNIAFTNEDLIEYVDGCLRTFGTTREIEE